MATTIQFQEYDDALVVRTTSHKPWWEVVGSAVVYGAFAGLAINASMKALGLQSTPWVLLAVLLAANMGFITARYPCRTELHVTNLDYISRTSGAWGHRAAESISRMDVRRLEFHVDSNGPEGGEPGGLYASSKHRSVCLLPDLTAEQTKEVIERIAVRFPDFREDWVDDPALGWSGFGSGFGKHVITLGLDRPKSDS